MSDRVLQSSGVGNPETPHGRVNLLSSRAWQTKRLQYNSSPPLLVASNLLHGGPETFWPITPSSLWLTRAPSVVRPFATDPSLMGSELRTRPGGYELHVSPASRALIADLTVKYLQYYHSEPLTVHNAADRATASIPQQQRRLKTTTYCVSPDGDCLRAAVCNAMSCTSPKDAATFIQVGPIPDDIFGQVSSCMATSFPTYNLLHCDTGTLSPDVWVMNQTSSEYILIIRGQDDLGDDVEHALSIEAVARSIIDCCEQNHLHMHWSVLQLFVGNAHYKGGVNVRRLFRKPVGRRTRKYPRRRKGKKTAARIEKQNARRESAQLHKLFQSVVRPQGYLR